MKLSNTRKAVTGAISASVAVATILVSTSAFAASPNLCRSYADTAVYQHGQNIGFRCGFAGFRWHSWWDGHYAWCLGQSPKRIWKEQTHRARRIANCRA